MRSVKWQDHIEQRPDVLGGKPIVRGTRVSVEMILERLGDGWSETELLQSFPNLRAEDIRAAQAFAAAALSSDESVFLSESA